MSDIILAVDLGRFKSVACIYSRTARTAQFRITVPHHESKPDAFAKLLAVHAVAVVVIEACAWRSSCNVGRGVGLRGGQDRTAQGRGEG